MERGEGGGVGADSRRQKRAPGNVRAMQCGCGHAFGLHCVGAGGVGEPSRVHRARPGIATPTVRLAPRVLIAVQVVATMRRRHTGKLRRHASQQQ